MKKYLVLLFVLFSLLPVFSMGAKGELNVAIEEEKEYRTHTDSIGRKSNLPYPLERISPSGNLSQMMLYALCPEKMIGLSAKLSENAMDYLLDGIGELPEFGTFYGKKANLNKEALIVANPEVIIDIGDYKEGIKEDLDVLEKQLGIPVVFIEGFLENTGDTFRKLGEYTGDEEKAEMLAEYADRAIAYAKEKREEIETPVRVYYSSSTDPQSGIPSGNFHAEVIELVGGENVIPSTFSSGANQISMEQLLIWNPEVILLADEQAYATVMTDARWKGIDAVINGRVYLIPNLPYPFIDNPPAVNRIIGIYYLGVLLYPELYQDIDLVEEMIEFYDLFYHYKLTEQEAEAILSR